MNEHHPGSPPPTIKLGDILYVIFRHKWKILIIGGLGILATCLVPFFTPKMYESEAKLFIKYVLETKSPHANADSQVRSVDAQGESIINTELQVLTSLDLAHDVAVAIGPERILAKSGGGTNEWVAAGVVRAGILPDVPKGSSVIRILFQHPDPTLVQPALQQIIEEYLDKHYKIHAGGGKLDEALDKELLTLRNSLSDTESSLRKAKTNAGVLSLEDSEKDYSERISKLNVAMLDAKAELAERTMAARALQEMLYPNGGSTTNAGVTVSNSIAIPAKKEAEYKSICRHLESLRRTEDQLLSQFTPESKSVKDVEAEIASYEKLQQEMEEKYPGLLAAKGLDPAAGRSDSAAAARTELLSTMAKVAALNAKIQELSNQLADAHMAVSNLDSQAPAITEWQRKLASDETRYKYFYDSREQARIDAELGKGGVSNISTIQTASAPVIVSSKIYKAMALILFGSIAAALALAFGVEYYLDPSLKRPAEVESKLGVPLFLSIPLFRQNGHSRALKPGNNVPLLAETNQEKPSGNGALEPAKQDSNRAEQALAIARESTGASPHSDSQEIMRPFSDALRDRLISFFEIKNMTHKPKLVALTSCREGSGVSTVAAGLAASLSETGDGNVLLVDMNQPEGSAQQFYRGDPACLDDALTAEKRDNALVQENLYVVAESSTGDNLPRALPRRFKNIVPKLKASDFDYIIFDLPPVTQISMTPRLARFMDVILMVIESETTDKEVLKKGIALLHESQPNIGTVLNKRRSYVPKWLQQEF